MEKGNNDDIPFPHQHPPANATRRIKSNRQRENNQMFDLSNGWRVCFICVLSVAFPKFGQRSTVAFIMDGKTHNTLTRVIII